MSEQQFSYFDPERETVYEPRLINRDPRESREYQEEQEATVHYVTPEQSMLRGEKLIPAQRTPSHANWIATALFLLMLLFGGFLWAHEVLPASAPSPYAPGYQYQHFQGPPPGYNYPPYKHHIHYNGPDGDGW